MKGRPRDATISAIGVMGTPATLISKRPKSNWTAEGRYASIEQLAATADYNPKVIRQGLRLAFLAPEIPAGALHDTAMGLVQIPKLLPLSWLEQRQSIG